MKGIKVIMTYLTERLKAEFLVTLGMLTILLQVSTADCQTNQKDFPVLKGQYLGQKPPGNLPEIFAPEIMTSPQGYHYTIIFSPDMTEALWSLMQDDYNHTLFSKAVNGTWSKPAINDFAEGFDPLDLFYSLDGNRIYFLSFHPDVPGGVERERIWYVERSTNGWSQPELVDRIIYEHPTHWTFSLSRNGNLYFTSEIAGSDKQDIYFSVFDGNKYLPPANLGPNINTEGKDFTPFIAPDESYLIFARNGTDTRKSDLFVSFKNNDGTWSKAISMGSHINSDKHDLAPYVTPDGRYLFFISQKEVMNAMYWVSTKIIEDMRLMNKNREEKRK